VKTRVETGSAPELDALRATATRLRAETDANVAHRDVEAAAGGLARWMGVNDRGDLRTSGAPPAKDPVPPLAALLARVDSNPGVRRERASAAAARARASSERAQARPIIVLGVGADAFDPTLPATNYRAMLSVDVPILDARGAFADREMARAGVASARAHTVRADAVAELTASYRRYQAARSLHRSLTRAVVPAAAKAASAAEEAYAVGRVALVDVLDAEKALIDSRVEASRARAAESEAWADVVHALGDG